jgi:hypothetical protein
LSYNPRVGRQITYFEEPDTIVLELDGQVTREEGREINRRHAEFGQGREHVFFLLNLGRLDKIDPEVRRETAQVLSRINLRGMVGYQCPLKGRVMAKLIFTALSLFTQTDCPPLLFFDSEEEARAWIRKRRRELAVPRPSAPAPATESLVEA